MPSSTEIRTQIYLTADLHDRAKQLARQKETSMAGVIRDALERYLKEEESPGGASWINDPLFKIVGAGELSPRPEGMDLNEFIDRVVYEDYDPDEDE